MKWSIGKKLGMGFGVAVASLLLLGYISSRSSKKLAEANDFETEIYKVIIEWSDAQSSLSDAESGLIGHRLTGAKIYRLTHATALSTVDQHLSHVEDASKKMPESNQRNIKSILSKARDWVAVFKMIPLDVDKSADADAQMAALTKSSEALRSINREIIDFDNELRGLAKQREKDADEIASATEWTIVTVSLVLFFSLVIIGIVLTRGITGSTNRLLDSSTKIAAGNLKLGELPVTTSDEIGELTIAFNRMLASIKEMTGQTRFATQNINSATAEILASTQEQAASAAEQAAAVQQTSATVEEINQSGNQVSERAKQVAVSAEAASATTNVGIQAVQNANKTMDAIREQAEAVAENIVLLSERTQTVGEIVATVNDIAEQSNLLALNAALEAAAAGEHGRRFSVVANELKNLADQSKASTVQVRTILGDIQKGINTSVMLAEETVKRVELGKKQSETAERTIRQMAESTVASVQAFQQIVAATNQQQIGFDQVTQALKNIRVASQQTAVGTQQMEKAAANLNVLGQQLSKSVERYEL